MKKDLLIVLLIYSNNVLDGARAEEYSQLPKMSKYLGFF